MKAEGRGLFGAGSPGRRGIFGIACLACALLIGGSAALAHHVVVDYFGKTGTGGVGGQFNLPREVAVNVSGAGAADAGDVYVVDSENHRIQRFSEDGDFEFAIGRNVIDAGKAGDLGDVFEKCVVAADCRAGAPGSAGGQMNKPQGIALDGDTGHIYVSDRENRRIQQFDGDGNFVRTWGFNVVETGKANDAGTGFEICDTEKGNVAGDCRAGAGGAGLGQFGTGTSITDSLYGVAVSPGNGSAATGKVYLANSQNRRIETYNLDGTSPANFGSSAVFALSQPRKVAVDSRGIVYASNTTDGGRIERYDSQNANGSGTVFLAPILATNSSTPGPLLANGAFAARATAGLAVGPDSDGAGSDEDVLYVLRHPGDGNPVVQQFGPVNDPGLTTVPITDDERHAGGIFDEDKTSPNVFGLGQDDSASRLYVSSDFSGNHRVYVFDDDPLPPPVPTLDPITERTDSSAVFAGSVDPKGGVGVSCRFEYSTDEENWTELAEPGCASLDPDGGAQPIGEEVTGLEPNTKYHVRLSVTREFDPTSTVTTPAKFFTTIAPPPAVSNLGAVQIEDTCARLVATIDPRNSETGYTFEYGLTPALGIETAEMAIGSGTTPITVSQLVCGLNKDTTYYFRVAATNLAGTTHSPLATFHTRALPPPPKENRRYEMVTPPDKNLTDIDQGDGLKRFGASFDGNAVGICTQALFGDNPGRMPGVCAPMVSRRDASLGWQTVNPFPAFCRYEPNDEAESGAQLFAYPAANFSRFAVLRPEPESCPLPPLDPSAPLLTGDQSVNLYLQEPLGDSAAYRLMNPETAVPSAPGRLYPIAGSDNFDHVVYETMTNQTSDSPPAGEFRKLYEFVTGSDCTAGSPGYDAGRGTCLRLVSKDPAGNAFTADSATPLISSIRGAAKYLNTSVSSDGSRIFFQNPVPAKPAEENLFPCDNAGCELYVRENSVTTVSVSASECGEGPCGAPQTKADVFLEATPTGTHAFFTSCARLTDESAPEAACTAPWSTTGGNLAGGSAVGGSKLYRWASDQASGNRLADLTADKEPDDGAQPDFRGLIGSSDDGDTAYFVASGQIVAGESTEPGPKLYRWRWNEGDPDVDYLGPYAVLLGELGSDFNWMQQHRQVTPDGQYLLAYTRLPYDAAGDRDSDADAYRWNEASGWTCLSCQLPGAPSAGEVDLSEPELSHSVASAPSAMGSSEPRYTMSDDGQRIFFATADALVPEDANGEGGCPLDSRNVPACLDVYVWHDGAVHLISSGIGEESARLLASTPSGDDVFFYTRERLVGWDNDDNIDIYDARVNGGFPEPPRGRRPCESDSCRGDATTPPSVPGAGSEAFQGPGNQSNPSDLCERLKDRARRKLIAATRTFGAKAMRLRRQARQLRRRAKAATGRIR